MIWCFYSHTFKRLNVCHMQDLYSTHLFCFHQNDATYDVSKADALPLSLSCSLPSDWVTSAPSSLTLGLPPLSVSPPFLLPLLHLLMAHGMACSLQTCCCPSTTLFLLASHWSLAGPRLPIGRPGSAHCPHHSHLSRHMRREGANTPGLPERTFQLEIFNSRQIVSKFSCL